MVNTLSFIDVEGQHIELLPARTVMSLADLTGFGGGDETPSDDGGSSAVPDANVGDESEKATDSGGTGTDSIQDTATNLLRG